MKNEAINHNMGINLPNTKKIKNLFTLNLVPTTNKTITKTSLFN
jgi:hypothetical protein